MSATTEAKPRPLLLSANCLAASIAVLESRDVNQVVADIAMAARDGELAFDANGGCTDDVWQRYLTKQGWQRHERSKDALYRLPPIPETCLLILEHHAIALLSGHLFDRGPDASWGEGIEEFWVRPPRENTEQEQ